MAQPNNPPHNLVGIWGAWLAAKLFFVFGIGAFMVPVLLIMFGLGYLLQFLSYLRRRWMWGVVLLLCCMGMASLFQSSFGWLRHLQHALNAPSVGGLLGQALNTYVLQYVGKVGASIVLTTIYIISLIYLTNFKLGEWCRQWWSIRFGAAAPATTSSDPDLERRARELEKQAKKLQEQIDKSGHAIPKVLEPTGLGADLKPVPEPTVRDLSVHQGKPVEPRPAPAVSPDKEPAPAGEGMVIPGREVAAATTADVLGRPVELAGSDAKEEGQPVAAKAGVPEAPKDETTPAAAPKPKLTPRRPKPIAVAATPKIGNYVLPSLDFLQLPDTTSSPRSRRRS